LIRVVDAQWGPGDVIVHAGVVQSGEVREGQDVHAEVDRVRREATARAHTATHVVHWTLRHVLGEHARQAGSLVAPGRLRFDFPNPTAVPRDLLEQAEEVANRRLAEDAPIRIYETTFDEARNQGAIALFGEKYGDFVRVVEVGDYSVELCGGPTSPGPGPWSGAPSSCTWSRTGMPTSSASWPRAPSAASRTRTGRPSCWGRAGAAGPSSWRRAARTWSREG